MRIISRSSIQQWQKCPRAYYHKYLDPEGGPGVEATDRPDYYALGIAFHEAGEILIRGGSGVAAGEAAARAASSFGLSERWQYWCRAVALAWERTEAEEFFETYDVITVEEDLLLPLTAELALYGRADAVLQDRNTGGIYVWNWKTTSDLRDWNRKFFFDIQTMVEASAVEPRVREIRGAGAAGVDGVLYGGVWKGPIYKGFTTSRLVGGYKGHGHSEKWSPTREKGLTTKFNAWEETFPFGRGLSAWISWLPEPLVRSHFAVSQPQAVNHELCEGWIRQTARAESDISHIIETGTERDQLDFFAQHVDDHCTQCPYLDICAGRSDTGTLLRDGKLGPRSDRHLRAAVARIEQRGETGVAIEEVEK